LLPHTNPDATANKIADNVRSIDDLSRELDMHGQSLDQVQEWIANNFDTYNNDGSGSIDTVNSSNTTSNTVESSKSSPSNEGSQLLNPSGFDMGEFLASPGSNLYEDDQLTKFADDITENNDNIAKRRRIS